MGSAAFQFVPAGWRYQSMSGRLSWAGELIASEATIKVVEAKDETKCMGRIGISDEMQSRTVTMEFMKRWPGVQSLSAVPPHPNLLPRGEGTTLASAWAIYSSVTQSSVRLFLEQGSRDYFLVNRPMNPPPERRLMVRESSRRTVLFSSCSASAPLPESRT